jgi:4-amino-4-deoxy-L-arabinose transferase-like glycosyltransferase
MADQGEADAPLEIEEPEPNGKQARAEGEPLSLQGETASLEGQTPPQENPSRTQINLSLELPPGAQVRLAIEPSPAPDPSDDKPARIIVEHSGPGRSPELILRSPGLPDRTIGPAAVAGAPGLRPGIAARLRARARAWPYSLETTLFGLGLFIYLVTRLVGLADFPIYFFTDEAIQTVAAADLIRNDLKDEEGTFLPTYFKNGPFYNLSASVYLQVLPYLLFGKSVYVTRAVSVLVSLLAAAAVGLTLRDIFQVPYWWAGVLLLSIAPAWFLHSRTAFETVLFTSFYAVFLYFYLLYRYRSPRYLNGAMVFAALAFYSYSPGQLVIGATTLLLLISDARYHWQNRGQVLRSLGLLAILALPYLRFRLGNPEAPIDHLRKLGSYWVQPLPTREKLARYASEYLYGLSPGYWFVPNLRDLARHQMKGYGNLLRATLPFAVIGLFLAVKGLRSPANRAVLIALLVAPLGSALVEIGITRTLVFVIPATLLTALGISWLLTWLERRRAPRPALAIGLFAVLSAVNFTMLGDALINGPTWFQDYGLGGMQYGARQLFKGVQDYLKSSPQTRMTVSPGWANGTDVVARFFLGDPLPIEMGSIDGHIFQRQPLDDNTLFVMTPEEYQLARDSGKFTDWRVEKTLPYPDGRSGFYFVRLRYVENIDQILAAEREQRRELLTDIVAIDSQRVRIRYPVLDMGEPQQMFDGDTETLARTLEANPAVIELTFAKPRRLEQIALIIGSTQAEITAQFFTEAGSKVAEFTQVLQGTIDQPRVLLSTQGAPPARLLRLLVRDLHQEEPAHIHIWEIELEPAR